jgi:CheY-like chemotaxis protein
LRFSPAVDRWVAARLLRSAAPSAPPVVLVSATPAAAIAKQFGVGFVRKPFPVEELIATIEKALAHGEGPRRRS